MELAALLSAMKSGGGLAIYIVILIQVIQWFTIHRRIDSVTSALHEHVQLCNQLYKLKEKL